MLNQWIAEKATFEAIILILLDPIWLCVNSYPSSARRESFFGRLRTAAYALLEKLWVHHFVRYYSKIPYILSLSSSNIPQTVCAHSAVLTISVEAGAWSGCSLWPAALYKAALAKSWRAFRLRKLAQNVRPRSGLILVCGVLPVNFRINLVKSWRAFRLHRLAQSVCPRSGPNLGRGIFPVNFRIKLLFWCVLWHVDMDFDCAGSHKVWS